MSVAEIERQVRTLPPEELAQFAEWFDAYRDAASPADDEGDELDEAQKQEILRRRAAYLADPSIAEPWDGTIDRVRQRLHELRRQKAEPR
jgi:putative addiction module component (TIGR02574 family)